MGKSVVSRILCLIVIYCAVFVILVTLQFSKKGNFSLSAGAMSIRGQYRVSPDTPPETNGHFLAGGVKVFFGGLEFNLNENNENGLVLESADGILLPVNPEYLTLAGNSARFDLPGGTKLFFNSLDSGGNPELRISAEFAENITGLNISFKPRRSSAVRNSAQPAFSYNGTQYQFTRSIRGLDEGKLMLSAENALVSYRARPRGRTFNPADYVISQAQSSQSYNDALNRWREQSFGYWEQNATVMQDEDMVIAYCTEALLRDNYRTAVASIPSDFIAGPRHSHYSSVFLGGMGRAFRSFTGSESEKADRITRMISEKNLDFLNEDHALDFLLVRGYEALANDVLELIRSAEPGELSLDLCPGLLEVFMDFRQWRLPVDNPVEQFIDQICLFVSENIQRDAERDLVFVMPDGRSAGTEFSLRLGKALLEWAESAGNTEWAEIGRSLVLSAVIQGENSGSGALYRILNHGGYYPRAAWLAANGIWVWTASPSVSAVQEGDILDISVSFPVNAPHFVIIRGIRPFVRLQLHDITYRSDPQFERYDSSGWLYYPQDQTLILKMRHRVTVEHIRVIYREEVRPVITPESNDETGAGNSANAGGETRDF